MININLLESRLQEYYHGKPKKILYLQADENLPYGFVINIMDIAKKIGIETIALIIEPIEKKNRSR